MESPLQPAGVSAKSERSSVVEIIDCSIRKAMAVKRQQSFKHRASRAKFYKQTIVNDHCLHSDVPYAITVDKRCKISRRSLQNPPYVTTVDKRQSLQNPSGVLNDAYALQSRPYVLCDCVTDDNSCVHCVSLPGRLTPSSRIEALQQVPSSPPNALVENAPNMDASTAPRIFNSSWDHYDEFNILDDSNSIFTPLNAVQPAAAAATMETSSLLTPTITPAATAFPFGNAEIENLDDFPNSFLENLDEMDITEIDRYLNESDGAIGTAFDQVEGLGTPEPMVTSISVEHDHDYVLQPDSSVLSPEFRGLLDEFFVSIDTVEPIVDVNMGPSEGILASSPNFMDTTCDLNSLFYNVDADAPTTSTTPSLAPSTSSASPPLDGDVEYRRRRDQNNDSSLDGDVEYRRRRDQNNDSSKRSREKQKQRRDALFIEYKELQNQNATLRATYQHLETEVADYKAIILRLMAGKQNNLNFA